MQIGFHLTNLFRFVQIARQDGNAENALPLSNATQQDISQHSLNARRVAQIDSTLTELDNLLARAQVRRSAGFASAISRSQLGLGSGGTATTLNSATEVNSATTSYTPFGPEFTGSGLSDALPELLGVYDGSNGNDTLLFEVTRTGVHGASRIDIKVYDSEEDKLDTIKIQPNDPLDKEYVLSNGLIFTLGAGTLRKNDTFYMDVFANTPSDVNPDAAFNATHDARPDFDYGFSVVAGSFDVNGVSIAVAADDSINSVVSKINNSAANVAATFDAASDSVKLTHKLSGSVNDIVLDNDSSGFIAATKLDTTSTPGLDREALAPLSQTQKLNTVAAGTFEINGNSIAVDPINDSLVDIVARINAANIGINASLIHGDQRVLLKSAIEGQQLSVSDSGTGLLDALQITEKAYNAKARNGFSRSRTYSIADQLEQGAKFINEIFDPGKNPAAQLGALDQLRNNIIGALRGLSPSGDSGFGLRYALDAPLQSRFISIDRRTLNGAQQNNADPVKNYLFGFVASLRGGLNAYTASSGAAQAGIMLNTVA